MSTIKDFNYPEFFRVDDHLTGLGYDVTNPAKNDSTSLEHAIAMAGDPGNIPQHIVDHKRWAYYLRMDLRHVLDVDAVVLLPGWQKSRGASLEAYVAKQLGIPLMIVDERTGELAPRIEIIGLSGYAQSGKDTAYDVLMNFGYERFAFADTLRKALYALDPIAQVLKDGYAYHVSELVDTDGWDGTKTNPLTDVRRLLQRLGTEVGRNIIGENVWVDTTLNSIPDATRAVITDVRFPNEAKAIKELGGQVWRIERPGTGPANAHPSETALDDFPFDTTLFNDGTLEDFQNRVEQVAAIYTTTREVVSV
jgi:hypothetical protein